MAHREQFSGATPVVRSRGSSESLRNVPSTIPGATEPMQGSPQAPVFFLHDLVPKWVPIWEQYWSRMDPPQRPHGLILGEDKATPCTHLLEAFLQFLRMIFGSFSLKIMVFIFLPGLGASGAALGGSWAALGGSWAALGGSWAALGGSG